MIDRAPIGFAHRGGAAVRSQQNSRAAFAAAIAAGASAVESDVALTADGVPVLMHPGLRDRFGRATARTLRCDLPPSVASLEDVYRDHGGDIDVALDMVAPAAVDKVVALARRHGDPRRLWLTYWRLDAISAWRKRFPEVRLVYPAMFLLRGRSDRLGLLREAGVDAVNLHHRSCSAARVQRIHMADMLAFAWGIRTGAGARRSLAHSVDGVFCDDVPGMVAALAAQAARRPLSAGAGS